MTPAGPLVSAAPLWGAPSENDSVEVLSARTEQLVNTASRLLATLEHTSQQVRQFSSITTRPVPQLP